jgi:hypothetical protein
MNVAQTIQPEGSPTSLYDRDFAAWLAGQIDALRRRDLGRLDVVNLLDEVESLGRSQRHAIESHLELLVAHLWKWELQPERRSRSWILTIRAQREAIRRSIRRNPSLRKAPTELFDDALKRARGLVLRDTGLDDRVVPKTFAVTLAQVLDDGFPAVGDP